MRKAVFILLFTLSAVRSTFAEPDAFMPAWKHVLPLSSTASDLIKTSVERSSTVEELLQQLEMSGLIVYLTDVMPGAMSGPVSYLTYLSNDDKARYLLVRIDRWRTTPYERIALFGHELQHALEVAAAPEVRDARTLASLYRRIGWEGQKDKYETEAAQTVGNRIRGEIAKGQAIRREPGAAR